MAHSIGTTQSQPTGATSTETTNPMVASFTTTSANTVLGIMLMYAGSTARAGGDPTFGSQTFIQADSQRSGTPSPECSCEAWYIIGPTTQTANISVPNSGGLAMKMHIASANAASGFRSAFDVANGAGTTGTNPTVSVTTTVNGDMLFNVVANGAQAWSTSTRTGTLIQEGDLGAWGGGAQYFVMTGSGAQAMSWTFGTSEDYGIITMAFKEVAIPFVNSYRGRDPGPRFDPPGIVSY